jgi:hypothetical protein
VHLLQSCKFWRLCNLPLPNRGRRRMSTVQQAAIIRACACHFSIRMSISSRIVHLFVIPMRWKLKPSLCVSATPPSSRTVAKFVAQNEPLKTAVLYFELTLIFIPSTDDDDDDDEYSHLQDRRGGKWRSRQVVLYQEALDWAIRSSALRVYECSGVS